MTPSSTFTLSVHTSADVADGFATEIFENGQTLFFSAARIY